MCYGSYPVFKVVRRYTQHHLGGEALTVARCKWTCDQFFLIKSLAVANPKTSDAWLVSALLRGALYLLVYDTLVLAK